MRRGFTLVEMVVATLVLAIGVAGAMSVIATATRASGVSERIQVSALLAQQRFSEIELDASNLTGGDQQGDFGGLYPAYHWRQSVVATEYQNLFQVNLTIIWGTPGSTEERTFTTYLRNDTDSINQQNQQQQNQQQQGQQNNSSSGDAGSGDGQ
jgi:prepilin-type N-terminal cleavage/methylation domain-containing protein